MAWKNFYRALAALLSFVMNGATVWVYITNGLEVLDGIRFHLKSPMKLKVK